MKSRKRLLVVDGYNVLHAASTLRQTGSSFEDARYAFANRLENYAGFTGQKIILVFDAWLSERYGRSIESRGALTVVFTRKGETADHYIERLCDEYAQDVEYGRLELRVATSDNVEQTVVFGRGAIRISAREFLYEMEQAERECAKYVTPEKKHKYTLFDSLSEETRKKLEEMRRGQ